MALQDTDQFYLQRPKTSAGSTGSSKEYQKIKTTVKSIDEYIRGGLDLEFDDLSDRLDQEIIDRTDGDIDLGNQIEGLSDRLAVIGAEIYNVAASGVFVYRLSQPCKGVYLPLANGCSGDAYEMENCIDNATDAYHQCIALSPEPAEDSRGSFYLNSSNYQYDKALTIFVSTIDDDGKNVEYDELFEEDYVEIAAIKVLDDGTEAIDNFNYAIYKIRKAGFDPYIEENGGNEELHRFDLEYLAHVGVPSVLHRFKLNFMVNMERELGKSYVQRKGDTMYGGLTIAIEDESSSGAAAVSVGINSRNTINTTVLNVTGLGSRGFPNLLPDLIFTSTDDVNIEFNTAGVVRQNYKAASKVQWTRDNYEFLSYNHGDIASNNQPYFVFQDNVIFNQIAEYVSFPNLLAAPNDRPEVIAPKGYVDLIEGSLDAKITDINNRIDTLANASDTFRYDMIVDTLIQECDDAITDETSYEEAVEWAGCVAAEIAKTKLPDPDNPDRPISAGGLFAWRGPVIENDTETIDGVEVPYTREVDIFVFDPYASLYEDPDQQMVGINWAENIKIGDYFEVATTALRNTAYGVWRCVQILPDEGSTECAKLVGVPLFKSEEEIIQGYIYKVKKYDKTSGLTLDDTEARYVKKSGDTMFGALKFKVDFATYGNIVEINDVNNVAQQRFKVDNTGTVYGTKYVIRRADGSVTDGDDVSEWTENGMKFTPSSINSGVVFDNELGMGFVFNDPGVNHLFTINAQDINAHSKIIKNIAIGVLKHDATTWEWLHKFVKGGTGITISKNSNNGEMTITRNSMEMNSLTDVSLPAQASRKKDHTIIWDPDGISQGRGAYKESPGPIKQFQPGNQVATTRDNDSNLEQYGFYYNATTDQLFLRV